MIITFQFLVLSGSIGRLGASGPDKPRATALLLSGAKALLPDASGWIDTEVLIRHGRIEAVGEKLAAGTAQVMPLDGLYLVPGLIDLHSHLLLQPYDEVAWSDQVLKQSLELRTIRGVSARVSVPL